MPVATEQTKTRSLSADEPPEFPSQSSRLALVVLAVFLLFTLAVPFVDSRIPWDDPVLAGEKIALSENIEFTPASGWNVEEGFRAPSDAAGPSGSAKLVHSGVTVTFEADKFQGTAAELLRQVGEVTKGTEDSSFRASGTAATTTTLSGATGVLQSYSSLTGDGQIYAFVLNGTGVTVTASGPSVQFQKLSPTIDQMVATIVETSSKDQA